MTHRVQTYTNKNDWGTPQWLFDWLDDIFDFKLDAAANFENAKCVYYLSEDDQGGALNVPWRDPEKNWIWLNPPYGRGQLEPFLQKCVRESEAGARICALIPVDTSTRWWFKHVLKAREIWFLEGRLKFVGAPASAPFPSAVALFYPYEERPDPGPQGKPVIRYFSREFLEEWRTVEVE